MIKVVFWILLPNRNNIRILSSIIQIVKWRRKTTIFLLLSAFVIDAQEKWPSQMVLSFWSISALLSL
jgi:hypothetical protein